MATVALSAENFERTIDTSGIVFVDFWASWCGPCRQFAPTYERASQSHPAVRALDVDTLRADASDATDAERTLS